MTSSELELHAVFEGRVQGVGFRWTCADHAERFGLVGSAENLKNGAVSIIAQGGKEELEEFVRAIRDDPGLARIEEVTCTYHPIQNKQKTFRIIH